MKGYGEAFVINGHKEQHRKDGLRKSEEIKTDIDLFLESGGLVDEYDSFGKIIKKELQ